MELGYNIPNQRPVVSQLWLHEAQEQQAASAGTLLLCLRDGCGVLHEVLDRFAVAVEPSGAPDGGCGRRSRHAERGRGKVRRLLKPVSRVTVAGKMKV